MANFPSPLAYAALGAAAQDLRRHVREHGENTGPEIDIDLKNAGINVPAPWCAAWVQGIYDAAALALDEENPLDAVNREALVADYVAWALQYNRVVRPSMALPGDLVAFRFGGRQWNHIGIVKVPPKDTFTFTTIEGNTNDDGSREGYKVAQRNRKLDTANTLFIRVK